MYYLMMFHGIMGYYFPEIAIRYEFGSGVSSSGNVEWLKRLLEDRKKMVQIMNAEENISDQQKKLLNAFIQNLNIGKIKKLFIKGKLLYWIKRHFNPRLTKIPENRDRELTE